MSSISPDFFGMDQDKHNEAKTLKQLLREKGINKSQLAKRMGIGRTTLADWENGRFVPTFTSAIRLAAELGVSLKTLAASLGYDASDVPADIVEVRPYQAPTKAIDHQRQEQSQSQGLDRE